MFVLTQDGALTPMTATQFALEADFQRLLEDYPDLLSGELIDPESPRKWLHVSREFGVPGEDAGSGIWSVDHLFLDQDGILTIVEVKRQSDTRLRREVVAQMIDYAAHGTVFWKAEQIRSQFESRCKEKDIDADEELVKRLGDDVDPSKFWTQVKTNLEAQKIRLLFVADHIPRELKRIVEFLNRQMNPAEVLALELKKYEGSGGLTTLAPSLFGQTESTRDLKSAAPSKPWDETSFFAELEKKSDSNIVQIFKIILDWMKKSTDHPVFGRGRTEGSITCFMKKDGVKLYPFTLWTNGKIYINFRDSTKPPFDSELKRQEWLNRLNEIPGVSIPQEGIAKQPQFPATVLRDQHHLVKFLNVMDWFVSELA